MVETREKMMICVCNLPAVTNISSVALAHARQYVMPDDAS